MRLSSVGVDRVHSEWAAVPVLGLGDLGGWALDLLQIRGSYLANAPEEDLASWLHTHLGEQDARMGFGYSDVVYGQINVYGVTTKSERHKRSYWTRTADGNGIGGRKAPVPYGS